MENIALTYTMESNVGVIISVAPFFTAMLSRLFLKSEGKLRENFFIGFVVAMAGVALISFNGSRMELNPAEDVLAVLAAFVWACYSILTRKIISLFPDRETLVCRGWVLKRMERQLLVYPRKAV